MATTTVDSTVYTIPDNGSRGWGTEVGNLLKALGDNSLLIKGGSIPLTSDADFGANFGLTSIYFQTRTAIPATTGVLRLANVDQVAWRNTANDDNLVLAVTADSLQFGPTASLVDLATISTTQTLTNKTYDAAANTLSNVDTTMWASGILVTSTTLAAASDLNIPSTLAVKTYIDNQISANDDASEIGFTPAVLANWTGSVDPGETNDALDQLASRAVTSETHQADTANPHAVTKTQVGLSNVDNTSDANKPTSIATQASLDSKASENRVLTAGSALNGGGDLTTDRAFNVSVDDSTIEIDSDALQVKDSGIVAAKLATDSVETAKIKDSNVTSAKLEDNIILPGTGRVKLPTGTTAQRPVTPVQGDTRFNTTNVALETYNGTSWSGGSGAGGLEPTVISASASAVVNKVYLVDMASAVANVTLTLPDISTETETLGVQLISTHATFVLTVESDASDTIDAATQFQLKTKGDYRILNAASSSNWFPEKPSLGNGVMITGWEPYTATTPNSSLGTLAAQNLEWRRVGTNLEIRGNVGMGTMTGAEAQLSLPSGLTAATDVNIHQSGSWFTNTNTSGTKAGPILINSGSGLTYMCFSTWHRAETVYPNSVQPASTIFGNNRSLFLDASIVIAEWANSGTTVRIEDLTARTKWVDSSVCSVTDSNGGSVVTGTTFRASRDSNGEYFLDFIIETDSGSDVGARTTTLGLGTTFLAGITQAVTASVPPSAANNYAETVPGTAGIYLSCPSGSFGASLSGKARLTGKPSWFDTNVENAVAIDAHVPEATSTIKGIERSATQASINTNTAATTSLTASDHRIQRYTDLALETTLTLPSTGIVEGDMFRIENETSLILIINSSGAEGINLANGANNEAVIQTGYIVLRALQDLPTDGDHWEVVELHELITATATGTGVGGSSTFYIERNNHTVSFRNKGALTHASTTSGLFTTGTWIPIRMRPTGDGYSAFIAAATASPNFIFMEVNTDGSIRFLYFNSSFALETGSIVSNGRPITATYLTGI